jgi:AraC-like DNA-binding protein
MGVMTAVGRSIVSPGPAATGLVEQIWVVRVPEGVPPRVALPDGRGAVVVRLGAPARWHDPLGRGVQEVGSVVRGPRSTPHLVREPGEAWAVGARLTPWALSRLGDGRFLVDEAAPLGEVLGTDEAVLAGTLRACWDTAEPAHQAARLLEGALLAAVRRTPPAARQDDLERLVLVADRERGLVRPVDLARAIDRSLACLHQIFAEDLGLTPTEYLAGVRLSCAARELGADAHAGADAAQVVATLRRYADAGFSPREVERFTGLSPLDLRRCVRGLEELLAAPA